MVNLLSISCPPRLDIRPFLNFIFIAKAVPLEQYCQFSIEIQWVVTVSSILRPKDFLEYMQATA
ncbi:MAG: hypothetical protein OET79_14085, partial [Nitrospirota bacterium]|nr:hypothetical protein [Nitrospirota bacterium]